MAFSNPGIDPKNGLYKVKLYNPKTDYKEFKPKLYEPPPYKDPLREPVREYKGKFEVPKYKPYEPTPIHHEYKEYKGPYIDPLTGKQYKKDKQKKIVEEKEPEPEIPAEPDKPTPKVFIPYTFGNTTGSTKRSIRIMNNLDF